ncbi:hypothetical protein CDIV41_120094 [Carnobacterium divergens]|nr:hypothetical protein CDIV41_120094 [Carnobacterium divergens]
MREIYKIIESWLNGEKMAEGIDVPIIYTRNDSCILCYNTV